MSPTTFQLSSSTLRRRAVPWLAVLVLAGALALADWRVSASAPAAAGTRSPTAGAATPANGAAGAPGRQAPFTVNGASSPGARSVSVGGSVMSPQRSTVGQSGVSGPAVAAASAGTRPGAVPDGAAASRAVDAYVRALTALDAQGVYASSDDGALGVAGILLDSASIDAARGARTAMTASSSSLAPSSETGGKVVFQGSVTVSTTISGPQGSDSTTDTISGPVTVADEGGAWRVIDFSYDGAPVDFWNVGATQTVDGLTVSVGYIVSYGDLTAALVTLRQGSGSADVQLQRVAIGAGAATENGTGDFTAPPSPSGILRFARIGSTPSSLALDFSSSSGQSYGFSFTFA